MSRLKDFAKRVGRGLLQLGEGVIIGVGWIVLCPFIACYFCLLCTVLGRRGKCGTRRNRRQPPTYRYPEGYHESEEGFWEPLPPSQQSFSVIPPPAFAPRRPLTPAPGDDCKVYQHSSIFFSRLPAEIRSEILKEAFGGQTVHLDRVRDHPRRRKVSDASPREVEGVHESGQGSLPSRPHTGHWEITDLAWKSRVDQWKSSVCHRNVPPRDTLHTSWLDTWRPPCDDTCKGGDIERCDAWPGQWPLKCTVGAMGWLQTCRQAYTEGVPILYGTNTFHFAQSGSMHITRFIRPAHLAQIRQIEVVLDAQYNGRGYSRQPVRPNYELVATPGSALYDVLSSCEHVQRLIIGIKVRAMRTKDPMGSVDVTPMLKEMDKMLMALPKIHGVALMFPYVIMRELADGAKQSHADLPYDTTSQLWRSLDEGPESKHVEWRCCSYPKHANPLHISGDPERLTVDEGRGYWIFRSEPPTPDFRH